MQANEMSGDFSLTEHLTEYSEGSYDVKKVIKYGKIVAAILFVVLLAIGGLTKGGLAQFGGDSGWVKNARIQRNLYSLEMHMPETGFGSKTVYAEKVQTFTVVVDVHEVNHGNLYVSVTPPGVRNFRGCETMTIKSPETRALAVTAKEAGRFRLKFGVANEKGQALLARKKVDVHYSANWEVN